ncbi:hypothetical protein GTU99_09230 [Streptomyces sp. PRKS01-65]|nr:hypothetical protein [Streptomyces harenosi]NEY32370.1 hypothetical protein [Streptomyces harenosi]
MASPESPGDVHSPESPGDAHAEEPDIASPGALPADRTRAAFCPALPDGRAGAPPG